jgi:hypothetical protein
MKYKLDNIVREFMIESLGASQIDNRYPRLLQIAISGLKDLNMDVRGIVKVERIAVDTSSFIANLPNDYLQYKKIFICYAGQQLSLGLNENMCPPDYDSCGNMTVCSSEDSTEDSNDGILYPLSSNVPVNSDGQFTGRQYGVSGGNNSLGYYRVYPNEGYIAFQNVTLVFDEIIMEYLADIDQVDGTTYVHPNDVEALKAWLWWKYIQRSGTKNNNYDKEDARRTYGREKGKARIRHNTFNVNELMMAVRSGYRSSPKL